MPTAQHPRRYTCRSHEYKKICSEERTPGQRNPVKIKSYKVPKTPPPSPRTPSSPKPSSRRSPRKSTSRKPNGFLNYLRRRRRNNVSKRIKRSNKK